MDQVHIIRHKVLVEGPPQRQVAKELGLSRLTVKKYLTEAVPVRRETQPRARPVWDAVRERVEALLTESGLLPATLWRRVLSWQNGSNPAWARPILTAIRVTPATK